jgi:antagonist of KipI
VVAVAGAEFDMTVEGRAIPSREAVAIAAGARLRFGARRRGARAYLAVEGGIAVPLVFGSRSTHLATGMGGHLGRALAAGDRVPLGAQATASRGTGAARPTRIAPELGPQPERVRVLPGPNADSFASDAIDVLQASPYRIATNSDRMGFRLEGRALGHHRGGDIISEATPIGALQVPASGQPILLMADRPTSGGYPKIATVISADVPIVAQLAPGDTVGFVLCSMAEALAALAARERSLMALEADARP